MSDDTVEIPFTIGFESQSWEVNSDGAMRTDDAPPHEFQPFDADKSYESEQ